MGARELVPKLSWQKARKVLIVSPMGRGMQELCREVGRRAAVHILTPIAQFEQRMAQCAGKILGPIFVLVFQMYLFIFTNHVHSLVARHYCKCCSFKAWWRNWIEKWEGRSQSTSLFLLPSLVQDISLKCGVAGSKPCAGSKNRPGTFNYSFRRAMQTGKTGVEA
eukprot:Gb_24097 [translate_table: standard]